MLDPSEVGKTCLRSAGAEQQEMHAGWLSTVLLRHESVVFLLQIKDQSARSLFIAYTLAELAVCCPLADRLHPKSARRTQEVRRGWKFTLEDYPDTPRAEMTL
jgi:hypothetical protein